MESWRKVWREGVAPLLSEKSLLVLQQGLLTDDPRLMQGATTNPPPLQCVSDWPCEGGCLLAYAGWQGEGLETVADVEEFFARICLAADQRLGEAVAIRWLLNWYDETPRQEMLALLLDEVKLALNERRTHVRETEKAPQAEAVHDPWD